MPRKKQETPEAAPKQTRRKKATAGEVAADPVEATAPMAYYSLDAILEKDADYNIIFGERSNGKTYAALYYALKQHVESGYMYQAAYIRRWKEDIVGRRVDSVWKGLEANGAIAELTGGQYTSVIFQLGKWWLANYDSKLRKFIPAPTPLAFAFALSEMEHDKSTSYPNVTTIIFDEFLTRRYYLPDEFVIFMNVLSTIIRQRTNVKIFMLGNTVNKYSPYFKEMGLRHIDGMKQGTIDEYSFGGEGSTLKIAVEYAESIAKSKPSNKYFAFDNSEGVKMIISGAWELQIYPHLRTKYEPRDIVFTYFIMFGEHVLQADVIQTDDEFFTYVHERYEPIPNPDTDLIYSLEWNEKLNYKRRLLATTTPLERKVSWFYGLEKVFFENNEVGEIVRNYIEQSSRSQFARLNH